MCCSEILLIHGGMEACSYLYVHVTRIIVMQRKL